MLCATLGLGPNAGVVTDAFHYDASMAMYGEFQKQGVPVAVAAPRNNRIDLHDLDALIQKNTRLVAISLIASSGGGVAAAIDTTMPSPGLISRPGRVGVTRHGSRKK